MSSKNGPSVYYIAFLTGAYYTCCSPFRIKLLKDNIESTTSSSGLYFKTISWLPQKVFCFLLTFLHLFCTVARIREVIPTETGNPKVYFTFLKVVGTTVTELLFIKHFWFDLKKFLEILNISKMLEEKWKLENGNNKNTHTQRKKINWGNMITAYFLVGLSTIMGILIWLISTGADFRGEWNLEKWRRRIHESTHRIFFIGKVEPTLDVFLAICSTAGLYHRRLLSNYCDCFFCITILTLRTHVINFTSKLSEEQEQLLQNNSNLNEDPNKTKPMIVSPWTWANLREHYLDLKILVDSINESFGLIGMWLLICAIFDYSTRFDQALTPSGAHWIPTILLVYYLLSTVINWYLCGDICFRMSKLKDWISIPDNRKGITVDELKFILNDLDKNRIAVKAWNVFPITFSLIAHMLGLILTYFIICVQVN